MRSVHLWITAMCLGGLALPGCSGSAKSGDGKAEPAERGDQPADADADEETPAETPEPVAEPADQAPPAAKVGAAAPGFTLKDLEGNDVALADYAGKTVVLEWFNPGCPFVKFAHGEGPLANMGNDKTSDDLVWLAINSGAPGKQGHGVETNLAATKEWSMKYPVLVDESGEVGKAYGAEKTPHVFVIDAEGVLRYKGALDNAPIGETQNEDYKNLLDNALTQLAAGAAIDPSETPPYGCSVKYAS